MSLPKTTQDLEHDKFQLDSNGDPCVNTCGEVDITGGTIDAVPGGLRTELKITTLDISSTALALPATALTDRNAMSIFNTSSADTLFYGNSNVTADSVVGTTSGDEIPPQGRVGFDITEDIIIFGRAVTGKTIRVKVIELA